MTRGEEFERLEFRATREKNDSLLESLFHPDCTYESNLIPTELKGRGEENIYWETLKEDINAATHKVIYEDENQIHVHKYYKLKSIDAFYSVITKGTVRDGKIFHTHEEYEDLDHDPSEGQPWTWENVRWYWEMITATEVTFEEWQAFADQKGIPTFSNSSTFTNSSTENERSSKLS